MKRTKHGKFVFFTFTLSMILCFICISFFIFNATLSKTHSELRNNFFCIRMWNEKKNNNFTPRTGEFIACRMVVCLKVKKSECLVQWCVRTFLAVYSARRESCLSLATPFGTLDTLHTARKKNNNNSTHGAPWTRAT